MRLLDRVVKSGLLLRDGGSDGGEYVFKHALVQEAAYESLLRRSRRTIHERAARVLDARIAAGATTAPELVARHFEAAGLLAEAASHYQSAAGLAAERSGHREAIAFLHQGIGLVRQLPDTVEGTGSSRSRCNWPWGRPSPRGATPTRNWPWPTTGPVNCASTWGTTPGWARPWVACRCSTSTGGRSPVGAELAERVLMIAVEHDDELLEVLGAVQLSLARSYQGRAAESLELAQRALAAYRPDRHQVLGHRFGTDQGVAAHVFAGWGHLVLGHLDRGIAQLVEAVDLAESLGRPFNRVFALAFLATGHWERGESAETLHFAERARRLAEEQGFAFWAGISGVWEAAERVITLGDARRPGGDDHGRIGGRRRPATAGGSHRPRSCGRGVRRRRRPRHHPGGPGHGPLGLGRDRPAVVGFVPAPPAGRTPLRPGDGLPGRAVGPGPPVVPCRRRRGSDPSSGPTGSASRSTAPAPRPATPVCWNRSDGARRPVGSCATGTGGAPRVRTRRY